MCILEYDIKINHKKNYGLEYGHRGANPDNKLGKHLERDIEITGADFDEYVTLLELSSITKKWIYQIKNFLRDYLNYVDWNIDKKKTLDYFKKIQNKNNVTSYKKKAYQIRKLLHHFGVTWVNEIRLPADLYYVPKRVMKSDILSTLDYFKGNRYCIQLKALTLLGATSGLRAEELYQLDRDGIDLENRTVYVKHDPGNGKTTKTKTSRVAFFSEDAKIALVDYLQFYSEKKVLKRLFSKTHILRGFHGAPIQVKDLRKFFSQEWDRRGGPTSIKKILMGHSLRGDVDLMHYNYQSEEDLKKIYDKVGIKIEI